MPRCQRVADNAVFVVGVCVKAREPAVIVVSYDAGSGTLYAHLEDSLADEGLNAFRDHGLTLVVVNGFFVHGSALLEKGLRHTSPSPA